MQVEEILAALSRNHAQFPREILEAAIAAKDEITPHLSAILERTADEPEVAIASDGWPFGYAMYLLAQFRDTRAYPLVAKIAALPEPLIGNLLGDTITEGLNQILASVSGGDVSLIAGLIENEEADEFARTAALEALLILVAVGITPREEVMDYFQGLFRGGLKREPSFVWDYLISAASELYPEEVYEDIEKAFADGLAQEHVTGLDWIKERMATGKDATLDELRQTHHLIDDAIAEMEGWAMYDEDEPDEDDDDDDLPDAPADWSRLLNVSPGDDQRAFVEEEDAPQIPYRAPKKVGRNDPCPCGSGKKYKKCHGA